MNPPNTHRTVMVQSQAPQESLGPQLTPALIRSYLQARGITESPLIHTQNYDEFLREKGVTELGRGGEGAVYFLRGHVVKLVGVDFTAALLREITHMLYLNPTATSDGSVAAMGERQRLDVPGLLWIYTLSNGGLSVGMRPFDLSEQGPRGSTLHDRLYGGPVMPREQTLRAVLRIGATLVYIQKKGVIHHDLKPANIYIPGDSSRDPVVFDLGQALWRRLAWGNNWLMNTHNLSYWYNGTYTYMHRERRTAHLCALNISTSKEPTPLQREAFQKFVPSDYDDVFAFAYIVRNIVRSPYTRLLSIDKKLLTDYYKLLMGLQHVQAKQTMVLQPGRTTLIRRVKSFFGKETVVDVPQPPKPKCEFIDRMETAYARLEPVIQKLMTIPGV